MASVTDAEGWTTTYQYDAAGQLVYAADATGRWTAFTYDDTGRVSSVTDPLGNRTTLAYSTGSSGGGTANVTDPLGARTTCTYESHGLLTGLTDAYQNAQSTPRSWSYSYAFTPSDSTKLQTLTVINPLGLQTQLTYDSMGNVPQVTDQGTDLTAPGVTVRSSTMAYRSGSSDLTQVTDAENNTTVNTWSASAPYRLLSVTDPLNNVVRYSYSTNPSQPGWLSAVTDALGNQTTFSYDGYGNVSSISQAVYIGSTLKTLVRNMTYYSDGSVADISELHDVNTSTYPVTHTDYDRLGRKVRVQHPDGSEEAWIYDPAGRVAIAVTAGGQSATYAYDGAGRLSSVTDMGPRPRWRCPACARRLAAQWQAVLELATAKGKPPTHFITLTLRERLPLWRQAPAAQRAEQRRAAVALARFLSRALSRLVAEIRQRFGAFECVAFVEMSTGRRTPGHRPHLHLLARSNRRIPRA